MELFWPIVLVLASVAAHWFAGRATLTGFVFSITASAGAGFLAFCVWAPLDPTWGTLAAAVVALGILLALPAVYLSARGIAAMVAARSSLRSLVEAMAGIALTAAIYFVAVGREAASRSEIAIELSSLLAGWVLYYLAMSLIGAALMAASEAWKK